MKQHIVLAIFLTLLWCALTTSIAVANVALGVALAACIIWFIGDQALPHHRLRLSPMRAVGLFGVLIVEVVLSTARVMKYCLSRQPNMQPGFVDYPLNLRRDAHIALLAQLITLTPGTLSVITDNNKQVLRVHALDAKEIEQVKDDIEAAFERRVLSVMYYPSG